MFNLTRRILRQFTTQKPRESTASCKQKSPEVKANPIFPTRLHALFYRRPLGLDLAREIQLYINSKAYLSQFDSKLVQFRFNSYCLHHWLISNRLNDFKTVRSWRICRSLNTLLENYTREHVYEYQNSYFNVKIYHELTRARKAICWSLDDYFVYGLHEKPLRQICQEDIFLEDTKANMEMYIQNRIIYLKSLSYDEITTQQINWAITAA